MSDNTYEGWRNYETWNVKLWLDNDEGPYHDLSEMTREVAGNSHALADNIESYVRDLPCNAQVFESASMASDLLGYALDSVDWHEIAEAYLEDQDR